MSLQIQPRDRAVRSMFDRVAVRYDLLNRVISFRLDRRWRRHAAQTLLAAGAKRILDMGTGTGDLALEAAADRRTLAAGLDFSIEMLRKAARKSREARLADSVFFVNGSALCAPFKDTSFDGVMTAFVLRNVSDLRIFFDEAYRLLKPGGRMVSLDMFPPRRGWFSILYSLYFYRIVPWVGGLLARDKRAYKYLSESVRQFHAPEQISEVIRRAGFGPVTIRKFLWGAVCMHIADKPKG